MKTMKAIMLTGTCAAADLKISVVPVPEVRPTLMESNQANGKIVIVMQ